MFTSQTDLQLRQDAIGLDHTRKQYQTEQACLGTIHGGLKWAAGRTADLPATGQHSGGVW